MSFKKYNTGIDLNKEFDFQTKEKHRIKKRLESKLSIGEEDLWQILLWKYNRVIGIDSEVITRLEKIKNDTSLTLESVFVKQTILELVNSKGIGFPVASTILKFLRPDEFPIIDVRAYRALFGKKINYNSYSLDLYIEYTNEVKRIAKEKGMELHEVDEQLYLFDKEVNGRI